MVGRATTRTLLGSPSSPFHCSLNFTIFVSFRPLPTLDVLPLPPPNFDLTTVAQAWTSPPASVATPLAQKDYSQTPESTRSTPRRTPVATATVSASERASVVGSKHTKPTDACLNTKYTKIKDMKSPSCPNRVGGGQDRETSEGMR